MMLAAEEFRGGCAPLRMMRTDAKAFDGALDAYHAVERELRRPSTSPTRKRRSSRSTRANSACTWALAFPCLARTGRMRASP